MSPRRLLDITLGTALAVVTLVSAVNWQVDPFGLFGRNTAGFYFRSERDIKQGLLAVREYDGLLMGSSKVAEYHPSLISSYRVLNASWSAALPEEMFYFLRDREPRPGFIALGLDFYMFNVRAFPWVDRSVFGRWAPARVATHLASLRMLGYSLEAVALTRRGEPPEVLPDGARNTARREPGDAGRRVVLETTLSALRALHYTDYAYATRRLAALRQIRAWSEAACVPLVVFINPAHVAVVDLIRQQGLEGEWRRFRADVRSVFPDVVDLSDSPYTAPRFYWRSDPDHYYPSTATRIFERELAPRIAGLRRTAPFRCANTRGG